MGTMIKVNGSIDAYRAEPDGDIRGTVIVIHEVWGLVDHIRDVADRFAAAGYVAVAPDLLTPAGLDPAALADLGAALADEARRTEAQPLMREATAPLQAPETAARVTAALSSVFDELAATPEGDGRTAVVGFCFGGTYAYALAAAEPRLAAAVPFYGQAGYTDEEASAIHCPILAFYGVEDARLRAGLPALDAQLTRAGVDFTAASFDGAGHAFFNDTNPITYRPAQAQIAWGQTLEFLAEHLE
ncbi:dienelactone hydrolase family protein [Specibacter cremeus]|uniref:dienelactone hydrolase family protein n=1 Tax=Specibacter cremeus TaxID=1629051 RepID=UPI000F776482|nr:dienelactone hydrolase family protein [Specibacter cremeus]